jgi:glucose-1-phosphate cytidylyltransferase
MKAAILAGGAGSRLDGGLGWKPKPMIEIGGRPVLWHVMMHLAHFGVGEFVIALGRGGEVIKRYVIDACELEGDLRVHLASGAVEARGRRTPDWTVDLIETGGPTMTGGRIRRLAPHLGEGTFLLSWGDCVSDVDVEALLAFHRAHGRLATLTVVRPTARYGFMQLEGDRVIVFAEKPQASEGWINGGLLALEPGVIDYIDGDDTQWEAEPLQRLVRDGQLAAYRHAGFWQCLDTLRERHILEEYWQSGNAPWKVWA